MFIIITKRIMKNNSFIYNDISSNSSGEYCTYIKPYGIHITGRRLETQIMTYNKHTDIQFPFISIIIATHNESLVVDRLMRSCTTLTYDRSKFEIIVVDDSEDKTYDLLEKWIHKIPNLKVIRRNERSGWKGGALNLALNNTNSKASYILILDADTILNNDILKRFVLYFLSISDDHISVVQGYPFTKFSKNSDFNWIARGIDFRLAQRNIIEFLAKEWIKLPVQITGSLFMIKSDVIRDIGFSTDLCEDWDLTLDLNFHHSIQSQEYTKSQGDYNNSKTIFFNPLLTSYCETTTKFRAYFRQRIRVSEGHTRGFRRKFLTILTSKIDVFNKIEFVFMGLQYAKFIVIFALMITDGVILLSYGLNNSINNDYMIKTSMIMQFANLSSVLVTSFMAISVCRNIRHYSAKDVMHLLLLNIFTLPAFVLGSLFGFIRNRGTFYRTDRNS
jgi:cellulose synthase/poly-beta-1,6-N-acetylglucosamine synthase-like glycosyltransferase